jgi:hypothetical protein
MDSDEDRQRKKPHLPLSRIDRMFSAPVVHLQETPTEIVIGVTGPSSGSPCTAQKVTLVGYVQLNGPVDGRRIVGNTA